MIFSLIDKKIREAFSNSAFQYEILANLQKEIGRELLRKIIYEGEYHSVLDVGMGTGWLTHRLKTHIPDSHVVGLDFAFGMLEQALSKYEEMKVVLANAKELPFKDEQFDLIASNLAYQWILDLNLAFADAFRLLKTNGRFCFTMFGRQTLKELLEVLEETLSAKQNRPSFVTQYLDDEKRVGECLKECGFREIVVSSEIIKSHFPDMMSLIRWLKEIGANKVYQNVFFGKDLLREANRLYGERFKDRLGVSATFEVIWVDAKK
jgi:malonyl-CoA O-methyltransferase